MPARSSSSSLILSATLAIWLSLRPAFGMVLTPSCLATFAPIFLRASPRTAHPAPADYGRRRNFAFAQEIEHFQRGKEAMVFDLKERARAPPAVRIVPKPSPGMPTYRLLLIPRRSPSRPVATGGQSPDFHQNGQLDRFRRRPDGAIGHFLPMSAPISCARTCHRQKFVDWPVSGNQSAFYFDGVRREILQNIGLGDLLRPTSVA
jgi:hypothetical protein